MPKKYFMIIGILILLTPLGLLAEGAAWGEWDMGELKETLGFIPAGIENAGEWWKALLPDYAIPFLGEGIVSESAGYILSALVGSVLVYGITLVIMRTMVSRSN
jgi:hypothetical protein